MQKLDVRPQLKIQNGSFRFFEIHENLRNMGMPVTILKSMLDCNESHPNLQNIFSLLLVHTLQFTNTP